MKSVYWKFYVVAFRVWFRNLANTSVYGNAITLVTFIASNTKGLVPTSDTRGGAGSNGHTCDLSPTNLFKLVHSYLIA